MDLSIDFPHKLPDNPYSPIFRPNKIFYMDYLAKLHMSTSRCYYRNAYKGKLYIRFVSYLNLYYK